MSEESPFEGCTWPETQAVALVASDKESEGGCDLRRGAGVDVT